MGFKQSFFTIKENLVKSLAHFLYPNKCLHCQTLLPPSSLVLCPSCSSMLDPIDPIDRCLLCFNPLEDSFVPCQKCLLYPSFYVRTAAVFDYEGPSVSLIKCLKYGNQPYLAQGMAAFLIAQLDRLQWPIPDALVPIPQSFTHFLERGYNQSALLAKEMGHLLHIPVWEMLKCAGHHLSQAALNLEQRKNLETISFKKKQKYSIKGKTLLIIDDVKTSGLTLQACAKGLISDDPHELYALTFCMTSG